MTAPAQTLDLEAVRAYLRGRLPGFDAPVRAKKFSTGQSNPTFLLETAAGQYVLRRKPPGVLLKSAHAVDREFRVQRALAGSAVPVPHMHLLCEDDSILGSAFYVMEHVAGRSFLDPSLPGAGAEERAAVMDEMNRVLAALHDVDPEAAGLADYGPPGDYFARQLSRWTKQYRASETGTIVEMEELISALENGNAPQDGQRRLVHGDFRIDNMIFAAGGASCRALLDWELSTIGHPYADLAAVIMQWRMPPGPEGRGLAGLDRSALGLPEDARFIESYCRRRGLPGIEQFGFCLGFSFFRMAAILQGVRKRALQGAASNPDQALRLGAYVPQFARHGLQALSE